MKITKKTTLEEIMEMLADSSESSCQPSKNKEFSLENIMEITDNFIKNRKSEIFKERAEEISLELARMKNIIGDYNKNIEDIRSEIPNNISLFTPIFGLCRVYYEMIEKIDNFEVDSLDSYEELLKYFYDKFRKHYKYTINNYYLYKLTYLSEAVVKLVKDKIIEIEDVNNIFIFKDDKKNNNYYFTMISDESIGVTYGEDNIKSGRYDLKYLEEFPEGYGYTKAITALENFLKETMNLK